MTMNRVEVITSVEPLLVVNLIDERPALHREIGRVGIIWPITHRPQALGLDQFHPERIGEPRDDVELQLAEIRALPLEPVSPDVRAGFGRDELGVHRNLVARAPHTAFKEIADPEVAADRPRVDRRALVGEGGLREITTLSGPRLPPAA